VTKEQVFFLYVNKSSVEKNLLRFGLVVSVQSCRLLSVFREQREGRDLFVVIILQDLVLAF